MSQREAPEQSLHDAAANGHMTETSPLLLNTSGRKHRKRSRKTSIVAIILLTCITVIVAVCGFILPQMAQSYVEQTLDYDVGSVSLEEITGSGANVRVTGDIFLNADKSNSHVAQRLTDFLLSLVGRVTVSNSELTISLCHEGVHDIAHAHLDNLSLQLAHARKNEFDMTTLVQFNNLDTIGRFIQDVLNNDIAVVPLSAVISTTVTKVVSIPKQVSRAIDYEIPTGLTELPSFNITKFAVNDLPEGGVSADAAIDLAFQAPINATIPRLVLEAAIRGCDGQMINLATGSNQPFRLEAHASTVSLKAHGTCDTIPKLALQPCKDESKQSPIDRAMQTFLAGNNTTIFLSGAKNQAGSWIQDLLEQIIIPIPVPGSQSQQFARDIVLSDVKFNLPSFFGGGGKPKISGKVRGTIDVPAGINVTVKVDSVHVLADLIYKGKKFAYVESPGWAPATSQTPSKDELVVEVALRDAPVTITNDDVFSSVVSNLLGGTVLVDVAGTGDVKITTSLGQVEAHRLPIEAKDIEIGGLGFIHAVQPKITKLGVISTSMDHMELAAEAEINNPTDYQIHASYIDTLVKYDNFTIGNISVHNLHMLAGNNTLCVYLRYSPKRYQNGQENFMAGAKLLGRYLSEEAVNITLAAHRRSIPDYPNLSKALAHLPLAVAIPVPRLIQTDPDGGNDNDDDDDGGIGEDKGTKSQFLVSAKFHVFSSTASFVLRNPLNETITIEGLHAVATYHEEVVGSLDYEYPITLSGTEPETETPRLPVKWKLPPSDILRKAVSGTLRVNATARAIIAVGQMSGIPIELSLDEVGAGVGF